MNVFKRASPTVTREIRLLLSYPRTHDIPTCWRAFSRGAVTDLGLWQFKFENPTSSMQGSKLRNLWLNNICQFELYQAYLIKVV